MLIHVKYVSFLFALTPEILLHCQIMSKKFSQVALTSCSSYNNHDLSQSLDRALKTLELPTNLHSSEVLLKPNLISAKAGPLACTEGAVILAVARWFIDQGARVGIGDSPAFGTAASVLKNINLNSNPNANLNLLDELAHLGVQIRPFTQGVPVELPGGGQAILARVALECDLLVNIPRV
ncbi:MAG: DUF362 domain-containing protein, partial [Candidatus Electrothrix sp. GM3_4]|nr:DUF362 domain-containing protein [Candidatus Electrothrix sp. GM3_4]